MTDIDLTPTNEAAARELYAAECVDRFENQAPAAMPAETKARMMAEVRKMARDNWDSDNLHEMTKLKYRELALAVLLVTHKDIARQAWDQCAEHNEQKFLTGEYATKLLKKDNPFQEDTQ